MDSNASANDNASNEATRGVLDTRGATDEHERALSRSELLAIEEDRSIPVQAEQYIHEHVPAGATAARFTNLPTAWQHMPNITESHVTAMQDEAAALQSMADQFKANARADRDASPGAEPQDAATVVVPVTGIDAGPIQAQAVQISSPAHPHQDADREPSSSPEVALASLSRDGQHNSSLTPGPFTKAYVLAYPNENFWHSGKGKWWRGLPDITTANPKAGVSGPGAREWKRLAAAEYQRRKQAGTLRGRAAQAGSTNNGGEDADDDAGEDSGEEHS